MNARLYACLLAFIFAGCTNQKYSDSSDMLIVPGLGISNVVAVGMTPAEMNSHMTDLQYQVRPSRWIPSRKPKWQTAVIPSLGIVWGGPYAGMHTPYYGFINFHVVADTNMGLRPFRGALSSGIDFSTTNTITPSEVINCYGDPSNTVPFDSNALAMLAKGQSIRTLFPETMTELLYYPADGIMFDFRKGILIRVAVYPKRMVEQSVPGYPPQGVGSPEP